VVEKTRISNFEEGRLRESPTLFGNTEIQAGR